MTPPDATDPLTWGQVFAAVLWTWAAIAVLALLAFGWHLIDRAITAREHRRRQLAGRTPTQRRAP